MNESKNRGDELLTLWRHYLNSAKAYSSLRKELRRLSFEEPESIVTVLQKALRSPEEKDVALDFVPLLLPSTQQQLLDELLPLAAKLDVGSYNRATKILLSLPQEWLVKELRQFVSRFLENEDAITPELLELYLQVDKVATRQLAEKAAGAADPNRRDLGEHFLRLIGAT